MVLSPTEQCSKQFHLISRFISVYKQTFGKWLVTQLQLQLTVCLLMRRRKVLKVILMNIHNNQQHPNSVIPSSFSISFPIMQGEGLTDELHSFTNSIKAWFFQQICPSCRIKCHRFPFIHYDSSPFLQFQFPKRVYEKNFAV